MNLLFSALTPFIILVNSQSITCEEAGSFSFPSNSLYQVTCNSKLPPKSFIIGSDQNYPSIAYNHSSGKWNNTLSHYSLTSYLHSTNTLPISLPSTETLYFSVCCINSSITENITLVKEELTPCPSNCSNNGECKNNTCMCQKPYFGLDCSLSYTILKGDFSKDYKIRGFDMKFFEINTSNTVYISENKRTVHIFLNSNNTMPSFFEYSDYSTPLSDYYTSNSSQFFSIFCPKSTPCSFTVYAKSYDDSDQRIGIIVLSSILGATGVVIILIILIQARRCRARKRQSEGLSTKDIEKFAPIIKNEGNLDKDTCTICLIPFTIGEDLRQITTCQHLFHPACLDEWLKLKPKCPNCNLSIFR